MQEERGPKEEIIWEEAKAYERRAAELEAQRSEAAKEGAAGTMTGRPKVL